MVHLNRTQFADLIEVPRDDCLDLSQGWLEKYKKRNGLKVFKQHGEAGAINSYNVDKERGQLRELFREYSYQLWDIFNMDETGLFYG